jgi:hypothetical protein
MLFGQNMIKEYTFLPRSFAAAQSLQNLDFEHGKQHEHIRENDRNKLK